MKQNDYLYKIPINGKCLKKKNEVTKLTQGHNIESAITTHT